MGRHKAGWIKEEKENTDATQETEAPEVDVEALQDEIEALKAENADLRKQLVSTEAPEVPDTMCYHETEAPTGRIFTSREAEERYKKGWHDTPAKFER
jgi:hypothetical protein